MGKREFEEIEVDVDAPVPKSKKELRLEKKGKLVEKVDKAQAAPKQSNKRSEFGVWIGNLPYSVDKPELMRFITSQTGLDDDAITRVHLDTNKGFAYVDTNTADQAQAIQVLSEQELGGRRILIKSHKNFKGRPSKEEQEQKNPPTRILFVGNLSFDTTDDQLEQHFQHCGEIQRIRTATFQDTGKCKGFSFIDFVEIDSAKAALGDKRCKKLNGRALRMEYGEDRSQRKPKKYEDTGAKSSYGEQSYGEQNYDAPNDAPRPRDAPRDAPRDGNQDKPRRQKKPTPGQALANAQRQRVSAAPSGKKITFD